MKKIYTYMLFFFSSLLFLCHVNVSDSAVKTLPTKKSYSYFNKNNSFLNKSCSNNQLSESANISSLNNDIDENDESNFEDDGSVFLTSLLLFKLNDNFNRFIFSRKNSPNKKSSVKICIFNSVFRI